MANKDYSTLKTEKVRDVLRVTVSDFHSGSNYALFLNRPWQGLKTAQIHPRSIQVKIRAHFEKFAEQINARRKGKRVELIHNGDAIDGDHHHSSDVCTLNELEQANIHIELMADFQKRIGWQAGDKIYYTKGTPVHVGDYEDYIAKELNAVPVDDDCHCHNLLALETNGTLSWFVHHGPRRGEGANEGNPLHAWLKNIYFNAQNDRHRVPDIVYTGHVHSPTYNVYVYRNLMEFKAIHGIILPSWQTKTEFAHMVAPVNKNKIGGVIQDITADGIISTPTFCVMETE